MNNLKTNLTKMTVEEAIKVFNNTKVTINSYKPPPKGVRPKFIIKWGPPASGKGSQQMRETIASLGPSYDSYIHLNIDDLVESVTSFKVMTDAVLEPVNGTKLTEKTNVELMNILEKLTQNKINKLGKVYQNVRTTPNKSGENKSGENKNGENKNGEKKKKGMSLDNKLDDILTQALQRGINITFETTGGGSGWPHWIWRYFTKDIQKYDVIVIFPLVDFEETWTRYKSRAVQMYKTGRGIRFTVNKTVLKEIYQTSYRNFRNALTTHIPTTVNKVIMFDKGATIVMSPTINNRSNIPQMKVMREKIDEYITSSV